MKLARVATGRPAIIAFRYGFHGRTAQAMALTAAKDVYRGRVRAAAGLRLPRRRTRTATARRAARTTRPTCTCDWEEQLDLLFHQLVFPDKVAAIIVEPVIGEGGYLVPPPDVPAAAARDHPRARDPARRGRGPDGLRADRRAVRRPATGTSSPTSSSWPRASRRGCRCRGSSRSSELHGRGSRRARTAARTAATSSRAPRRSRRSTSSRTRAWSRTPASAARSSSTGCGGSPPGRPSIGDVRGLGLMVALEFVKPGEGDGRVPEPGAHEARPAGVLRAEPAGAHRGHVRERDPDHPAARDDGRGGRPGAGDPRRGARRRRRIAPRGPAT